MSWRDQLKQVFRRLARSPLFTAVTLLTLAVGIGANTAIFTVLESVLLKPLPYPQPNELIGVGLTAPGVNIKDLDLSPSDYFIFRDQSRTFQDFGMYSGDSVSVTGVAEPEHVRVLRVTDGVLNALAVPPMIGRIFTQADDTPGSPNTVMLTYGYWRRKFGSDTAILGRTIKIDGDSCQVIGVMPRKFRFLDWEEPELILPFQFDRNKVHLGNFSYDGIARLKPGATLEQANTDVGRMLPIVLQSFPAPPGFSIELFKHAGTAPNLRPLKQDVVGDVGKLLWVLMGSIGMVLLIACANVANLLLVRAEGRQQELTIRAALGASRARIAAELLFESFIIGLLGSVLGLALAFGALRLLVTLAPAGLPRLGEIGIDLPVLLFTLVVSLLASLLFGSIPVLKYGGSQAGTGLREGGRTLSQSRDRHRARNTLVVVQVGLAFVLLICSGLMIRTFRALTQVNPGFVDPTDVQTFGLSIPESEVKEPEAVVRMEEGIMRKIAAIPGVTSAGITTSIPMGNNRWMDPVFADDHAYTEGQIPPLRRFRFVSPEAFATLGIPVIAGRNLTWADIYNQSSLALISANFASEYWGSPSQALGKRIRTSAKDNWSEIIGVVGNTYDDGVNEEAPTAIYWPLYQKNFESDSIAVRRDISFVIRSSRAGSESLMKEVRDAVWSFDGNLPLANARTLEYYYSHSMARTSFTLVMLVIAGGMALLLGTVGLYGVIAYSVSQRTREIGIRIALGAQQNELAGMFVRQGLWLAGAGVACGIAVAIGVMRLMSSLLFHVSPADPITYGAVSVGLIATAAAASYLPSRRAAGVDPVDALRAE